MVVSLFKFVSLKSQVRIARGRGVRAEACNLLKKWLWHMCFPVNFAKFLRIPFLQNTSGCLLLDRIKCCWQNLLCCASLQNAGTCLYRIWESNFWVSPVHLLRFTCFSFYIITYKRKKVCEYLSVFQLFLTWVPGNPEKVFLKNETFGYIEDFLKKLLIDVPRG